MRPAWAVVVALLSVAGCGSETTPGADGGRLVVMASFKPLAELVERIGGDLVEVDTVTPPGVEPHDVELSPDDVDRLEDADLVVYLGAGFQPAVEETAERLDRARTVDVAAAVELHGDPHFWLDPRLYADAATAVAERLVELRPDAEDDIEAAADELRGELDALAGEIEQRLDECETKTLVTAHDAFGHFARVAALETEPITGLSPEAEPDPKRLADLTEVVRRTGTTTIFTEELLSPEVAKTLARETGATTAVLDPLEASDVTYVEGMRANIEAVRKGLRCT